MLDGIEISLIRKYAEQSISGDEEMLEGYLLRITSGRSLI